MDAVLSHLMLFIQEFPPMSLNYSPNNGQPQFPCAQSLTITEAVEVINILARQEVSRKMILEGIKEGCFTVPYPCGMLIFSPSCPGKQGKPYRLSMNLSPWGYPNG